jgi:hypothetical protein
MKYLALILLLLSLDVSAQWKPIFGVDSEPFFRIISYISAEEAYATNGDNQLYYTRNNWETINEVINLSFNDSFSVEYLKMVDRVNGTLVLRHQYQLKFDVFTTTNGGYSWDKKFASPKADPSESQYYELLHFDENNNKLFVLLGNTICFGAFNGDDWKSVQLSSKRKKTAGSIVVLNDSTWRVDFGIDTYNYAPWYTKNSGENWKIFPQNPGLNRLSFGLDNEIYRMEGEWLEKWSPDFFVWAQESRLPYMDARKVKKLSDRFILVYYYYWPESSYENAIYDHQEKSWTTLKAESDLWDFEEGGLMWLPEENGFVTKARSGNVEFTADFGLNWQLWRKQGGGLFGRNLDFIVDDSLMITSVPTSLADVNELKLWSQTETGLIQLGSPQIPLLGSFKLNSDPHSELLILNNDTLYKIDKKENQSFTVSTSSYTYNGKPIELLDASKLPAEKRTFIIGDWSEWDSWSDSIGVFEVDENEKPTFLERLTDENNVNHLTRLIQNESYLVVEFNRQIKVYRKDNGLIKTYDEELVSNHGQAWFFTSTNDLWINQIWEVVHLNLETNQVEVFPSLDFCGVDYITSLTFDGGDFWFCDGYGIYKGGMDFNFTMQEGTHEEFWTPKELRFDDGRVWMNSDKNVYEHSETVRSSTNSEPDFMIESIGPNPVVDDFTIWILSNSNTALEAQLINNLGQNLYKEQLMPGLGRKVVEVPMNHLPFGFYYLNIFSENGLETVKLIKQ